MIVDRLRDLIFVPLVLQTHAVLYQFVRSEKRFREAAVSSVLGILLYVACDQPLVLLQRSTANYKMSMTMHHVAVAAMSILLLRNPKLTSRPYLQRQIGIFELFEVSTLWITVQYHFEKWVRSRVLRRVVDSIAIVTFIVFRIVMGSYETCKFLRQFRREPDVPFWTVVGIHLVILMLNYFWGYKLVVKYFNKGQTADYTNAL